MIFNVPPICRIPKIVFDGVLNPTTSAYSNTFEELIFSEDSYEYTSGTLFADDEYQGDGHIAIDMRNMMVDTNHNGIYLQEAIDVTNYKTLKAEVACIPNMDINDAEKMMCIGLSENLSNGLNAYNNELFSAVPIIEGFDYNITNCPVPLEYLTIDISDIAGSYYVGLTLYNTNYIGIDSLAYKMFIGKILLF